MLVGKDGRQKRFQTSTYGPEACNSPLCAGGAFVAWGALVELAEVEVVVGQVSEVQADEEDELCPQLPQAWLELAD
jgi:hypothetical protein